MAQSNISLANDNENKNDSVLESIEDLTDTTIKLQRHLATKVTESKVHACLEGATNKRDAARLRSVQG